MSNFDAGFCLLYGLGMYWLGRAHQHDLDKQKQQGPTNAK